MGGYLWTGKLTLNINEFAPTFQIYDIASYYYSPIKLMHGQNQNINKGGNCCQSVILEVL